MNEEQNRIDTPDELMSIGILALKSGINSDTIRAWERRYGRPAPVRLPSGHRRYTPDQLRWLRRVAEALAHGYRPSQVTRLGEEELDRLLFPKANEFEALEDLDEILDLARAFDTKATVECIDEAMRRLGHRAFILDWLTPLLDAIGRAWGDGELGIRHEHFLSELFLDALRDIRRSVSVPTRAPCVAVTTLSGESHSMGIQMVGAFGAIAGLQMRILSTETPNAEIAAAVHEMGATGVAISVSLASGGVATDRILRDLREVVSDDVLIAVGGKGARAPRRGPRGIDVITSTEGLEQWFARVRKHGRGK